MNAAYLSLGSNICAEANLKRAVSLLAAGGEIRAVSPVYLTEPVGAPGSPPFLNAAVLLLTGMSARDLKAGLIAGIEATLGRVRVAGDPNAPRTIDIDISLWNPDGRGDGEDGGAGPDGAGPEPGPDPDPDILTRPHIAVPLAAIAPDLAHPTTGESLAAVAARLAAASEGPPPRERPDIGLDPDSWR